MESGYFLLRLPVTGLLPCGPVRLKKYRFPLRKGIFPICSTCLTKKVIKRAAMKYNRDISRRLKHEVPFSEISDLELNKAGVYDKYSSDYTAFNVLGMEVQVSDDQLSKALKCLPERKRNIILLSYFMDMSDAEIGELMNVVRTTVYRHRTSTLEDLRKMMEEE